MATRKKSGLLVVLLGVILCSIYFIISGNQRGHISERTHSQEAMQINIPVEEFENLQPSLVHPSQNSSFSFPASERPLSEDITIVTAFINLGKFQKGDRWTYFTPDLYHKWMKVFSQILNPVVFYLDTVEDITYIHKLRQDLDPGLTKIILLNRTAMWAFSLRDQIAKIFSQPSYPKHYPNTVLPEYSCAMHAKYEVMLATVVNNPFKTKYFAWLDIGLFRDEKSQQPFKMALPPNFNIERVAYTQVYHPIERSAESIFLENHVWVCGCFFIAEVNTMLRWVQEYMQATQHFLNHDIMSTDQQIIYSMFMSENYDFGVPQTNLQVYKGNGRYNSWFHLGYVCREEGKTGIPS